MTRENRRKAESARPRLVAVIASDRDLDSALGMRTPPDFFELRLDAVNPASPERREAEELDRINRSSSSARHRSSGVDAAVETLPARLIITARHPAEGGVAKLSSRVRFRLLDRFIEAADYVDVELRSVRAMAALLEHETIRRIISFHDFNGTPPLGRLREKLDAARAVSADIFKVATRVENRAQLARLLQFFDEASGLVPISAMGMGALGRESRIELARRGSVLNYGYITRPQAPGQLSIVELRRLLGR